MNENLRIRDYEAGDEEQINRLFNHVFKQERTLEQWRWKHMESPFGPSKVKVAHMGGNMVAHGAWMPIPLMICNREYMCYQGVDAMSHPDFREMGIFNGIQKEITSNLGTVMYASARKRLLPLYMKIVDGLVDVGLVKRYRKVLGHQGIKGKLKGVLGALEKERGPSGTIDEIDTFGKQFDELWDEGRKRSEIMIVRNSKYLNWRFVAKPENGYRIFSSMKDGRTNGYSVLTTNEGDGYILDIFTDGHRETEGDLIAHALDHFKEKDVGSVICYMMDLQLEGLLQEMGFSTDWGFDLIARSGNKDIPVSILENRNNWYVTYGDIDPL